MTSILRHLGSEDPQLSCSSINQVPASQPSTTKYHQQTVTFTALSLKLSPQIPQIAHLRGNSSRQEDSPLFCPKLRMTEKSPDRQHTTKMLAHGLANVDCSSLPWGLHMIYKHNYHHSVPHLLLMFLIVIVPFSFCFLLQLTWKRAGRAKSSKWKIMLEMVSTM